MKIALVFYDRLNYTAGPAINALRLLPELKKRGHEVYALVPFIGKHHPNADILLEQGIQCFLTPYSEYSIDLVKWFLKIVAHIYPDIFIANISLQACFAGKWIQQWGIPVIITQRGNETHNWEMTNYFLNGPSDWRVTGVVSVNNYLHDKIKKESKQFFFNSVIPSGVDIPVGITDQKVKNKLKLIYAGRLTNRVKRVGDLLIAFHQVLKANDQFELTLVGSGSQAEVDIFKKFINDNHLNHNIFIKDSKFGAEYKNELTNHNIIVLFSEHEGMPGALMDGMSCGLIPITTYFPGIHELIQHDFNGYIIDNNDVDFKDILLRLFHNEQLRMVISQRARNQIIENFSLAKTTDQWESFLREVYNNNPNKRKIPVIPEKITLPAETSFLKEHKVRKGKIQEGYMKFMKLVINCKNKLWKVISLLNIENSKI